MMRVFLAAALLALPCLARAEGPVSPPQTNENSTMVPASYAYTLRGLNRLSVMAVSNNPRVNAVMTAPPAVTVAPLWGNSVAYSVGQVAVNVSGSGAASLGTWYVATTAGTSSASCCGPVGTGTGIVDGTVVWSSVSQHATQRFQSLTAANTYLWGAGTGAGTAGFNGVVTFTGGVTQNNPATNCAAQYAATVAGVYSPGVSRWQFATDATFPVLRMFNVSSNTQYRVIVNGQYASTTPVTLAPGGWGYILLDFSAAGGRAVRDIVIEHEGAANFCAVDVGVTEGVYKSVQRNAITTIGTGDSIMASAGADIYWNGWFYIVSDFLGASNAINTGIGGTGYLVASSSGTAITRISDVINALVANPNAVILDENGFNDISNGFTPAQIQAASLAYMRAIRTYPGCQPCATVPIVESGIWAASNNGGSWANGVAAEQAKQAAVAAMNDPRIIFVPLIQAPGGSILTGTGNDQAPNGTGNADIYLNGLTLPHPNTKGHAFYAQQYLNGYRARMNALGY